MRKRDNRGYYFIEFPDDSCLQMNAAELETEEVFSGCSFYIRDFSPLVMGFIYELAVAANLTAFDLQADGSDEYPHSFIVSEDQRSELPEKFSRNSRLLSSPEDLAKAIGALFGSWQAYRDGVVSLYSGDEG